MMKNNKMVIVLIALLVLLGGVLVFFLIRDRKMAVIERKTGIDIPEYCDLKEYVSYGSLFNRTGSLQASYWFYLADILLVSTDIVLYFRNLRIDRQMGRI